MLVDIGRGPIRLIQFLHILLSDNVKLFNDRTVLISAMECLMSARCCAVQNE
jgi:hypothetical protein